MSLSPAPLIGATIAITQNGSTVATLTTDSTGSASTTLPVGTYTVTLNAPGFTQLQFTLNVATSEPVVFSFEVLPKRAAYPVASESMSYSTSAATATTTNEGMNESVTVPSPSSVIAETVTLTPKVSEGSIANETMTEAPSVAASNQSWQINILIVYDTSTLQTSGVVSPSGMQTVANGSAEAISVATKQYALFNYALVDGQLVLSNSVNFELVNTAHNFTVPSQVSGTVHQAVFFFRASWELSVSGSTADGTYEVLSGQSYTATNNLGSPPVCYYTYDNQGHITSTHYATYQWYLDGVAVGYGQGSYTVSAQQAGTSHTLSCQWTCAGV